MKLRGSLFLIVLVAGAALLIRGSGSGASAPDTGPMASVTPDAGTAVSLVGPAPAEGVIQVFKSPTCGCCADWVKHLEAAGFTVEVQDIPNMMAVKGELGVPGELGSCHTARIAGYLVEGHVPAADIQRLLEEKPDIRGISVPGMPVGSPGMEVEGRPADRYDVVAFDAAGRTSVFASH